MYSQIVYLSGLFPYFFIACLAVFYIACLSALFFKQITTWLVFQLNSNSTDIIILEPQVSFLNTTSTFYLSFTIDAWLLRKMSALPIRNKKLIKLARQLSPAYVRYGGTSADCLYFNEVRNFEFWHFWFLKFNIFFLQTLNLLVFLIFEIRHFLADFKH